MTYSKSHRLVNGGAEILTQICLTLKSTDLYNLLPNDIYQLRAIGSVVLQTLSHLIFVLCMILPLITLLIEENRV